MNVRTIASAFCLAAFCMIPSLSGADDPFEGTWKLNTEKSKYVPGPAPQSMIVTVKVQGDTQDVKSEGKMSDGTAVATSFVVKLDGTPAPITGDPQADMISARKTNDHMLKSKAMKGGKVVGQDRVSVSPDGKTLTVAGSGVDSKGAKQKWTEVYDKQ
jgi:hypothetical protein